MPAAKFVAIDIETTGLYPTLGRSKIFCCAVNDGNTIKVVERIDTLRALLEDNTITKIIHNAAFDCFWLAMLHGITVRNIWDTQVIEQVILGDNLYDENNYAKVTEQQREELSPNLYYTLKRYGLAELDKSKGDSFRSGKAVQSKLTADEIEYVKDDVRYLLHLQAMQQRRLEKLDLTRVAFLENNCVEVTVWMRRAGLRLNTTKWKSVAAAHRAKATTLLKLLPSTVSNWNSPAQAKKYFNSIGIPIISLTDITEDFQAQYNNEVLNRFVEMRLNSTYASKYSESWLVRKDGSSAIDSDGRLRADFFQVLNTGRYSVSNPPIHGLPRDGGQRSAFEPAPGCAFVRGDFGGQELGTAAAASKEELWIKALLRGDDPLSLMASMLFTDWAKGAERGCTFPKKCKCKQHRKQRQDSKEITYGIMYGAWPKSISIKIKRTKKETTKLFEKHKRAAPALNRWLERNARETVKTRISYSADVYRRRRTVRDPQEWMVRNVGYNNPVQSCAANMLKLAMITLYREGYNIVFPWHDEIILEVPKTQAKKAAAALKAIMEKAADYCTSIPGIIKVEPVISTTLAKA